MNGPFLCERMLLRLPLHDELVSSFVVSCFVAECRLAPRRHWVITLDAAFTAAMRMVHRIHHNAAVCRTDAHVTRPARFPDRHILMVQISNLPDGRAAV